MIPVVLIHKGQSARYPLGTVIQHDADRGNSVHLIADAAPAARWPLNDYYGGAGAFEKYYVHLSGNHFEFEKFCIARWFVLREWMQTEHVDRCLYTDSDVLLYCQAEEEWARWAEGYAFTLALGTSPATSYFTFAGLQAFCDFVLSIYALRNEFFREFERIFHEMQAQGLPGGICDMTLFRFFKQEVRHVPVGEMAEIKPVQEHLVNGDTWDHNLNSADGFTLNNGRKGIHWDVAGRPYGWTQEQGQRVRFNSLHFQGQAKGLMSQYVRQA